MTLTHPESRASTRSRHEPATRPVTYGQTRQCVCGGWTRFLLCQYCGTTDPAAVAAGMVSTSPLVQRAAADPPSYDAPLRLSAEPAAPDVDAYAESPDGSAWMTPHALVPRQPLDPDDTVLPAPTAAGGQPDASLDAPADGAEIDDGVTGAPPRRRWLIALVSGAVIAGSAGVAYVLTAPAPNADVAVAAPVHHSGPTAATLAQAVIAAETGWAAAHGGAYTADAGALGVRRPASVTQFAITLGRGGYTVRASTAQGAFCGGSAAATVTRC